MGFIVKQPIRTLFGENLNEFYVRIENCNISKTMGCLITGIAAYPSSSFARTSHPRYTEDYTYDISSDIIPVKINYNETDVDYPTHYIFALTSSVLVDVPVYEYNVVSESINYYDFDENGDVVEKTRIEYTSQSIQTGTEQITKYQYDTNVITGSALPFAYELVKSKYGDIFGHENIIDLV
jgi:hypothetical protein